MPDIRSRTYIEQEVGNSSLTVDDFEWVRKELYQHAGIVLADHKKDMVYNRLSKRLKAVSIAKFKEYFAHIKNNDAEYVEFINAMTTNLTSFYRERHHFDFLTETVLPEILQKKQKEIRCWSAGCSLGEEAYTLAIVMNEAGIINSSIDTKILATDIDSIVLTKARTAIFEANRLEAVDSPIRTKYFKRYGDDRYRLVERLKNLVHFKQLNLLSEWPMKRQMDFVFFRNVMIYFDNETQKKLLERMADQLKPNGYLFVGHSETPFRLTDRFKLVGKTIYRRMY